MEANRYEIKTLMDFLNVPEDKIDECLVDLKAWIGFVRHTKACTDILLECGGKDMRAAVRAEVSSAGFVWIDDGKHDAHITVRTEVKTQ